MTAINIDKLYAKFSDITESINRLKAFRELSFDDFIGDQDKLDIASFRLVVATEAAIDICMHVAAKVLRKIPEEYAGCFDILCEHQLIDHDLSSRLAKMARFRNLLTHRYWEIDYSRVYEIITGPDLGDLEEFTRHVAGIIEKEI